MEEEKVIRALYHKHPLILKENVSMEERVDCYGCGNPVGNLEKAYVCMEQHCSSRNRRIILHRKCGELPNQIRHPKHPNHPIHLFDFHQSKWHLCYVCRRDLDNVLGYRCSSCDFDVDITCEKIGIDALLEERKEVQHPSHPEHPLTLMRKPAFAFYCDGCGAQDVDMAYICSTCEYMVHKSCAALPLRRHCHHHHHHLSLAFSFPKKHLKYNYKCEVCDKLLDRTCWVYYCGDCRYFVHIRCLGSSIKPDPNSNIGDEDVLEFPLYASDISNKLLTPFVMREKGANYIPNTSSSNSIFIFKYHEHPLSLVREAAEDKLVKICNVCITPISSPPYYKCDVDASTCSYFIHFICCFLPNTLHSSQLYGDCQEIPNKTHIFSLYADASISNADISYWYCNLCDLPTNGMGYECQSCNMKIDIKCASLPPTIRHASHPVHKTLTRIPLQEAGRRNKCHGCYTRSKIAYHCSSGGCDFALNLECLLMPMSVREVEWDKRHPLLLTFDASLDHPSDFFCEFCEKQMHPKSWMYHCRKCDVSFHLVCLKNASGWYRNVKFGRRFQMDGIHANHALKFTYVTLKRRCDLCEQRVYTDSGFECADCYYVVCQDCGAQELERIASLS
ncbi:uncharacterized protein LOC130992574 [Salvia miltiorrhiza]|uniref:uncharacterized protein LOC130992574 n=1 Tax=Salvia miltiorrhiza TaxID=226208 RepID=UPI0025AC4911|nr:uncharacterized protein LOC130992574 [Salvia miltiorrhiza]